jgi:hypothetical protein
MTNQDYSIAGLKGLLNDLENLSTCLMTLPEEHVDATAYGQLLEDQYALIQMINGYVTKIQLSKH